MPKPVTAPLACVFDLDGTLIDSLRDIGEALNIGLDHLGLPTHPPESYRTLVGEGIPLLCQRAIGATHPHLVTRLGELVRAVYRTRPMVHTQPYPGVPELIARLHAARIPLGVLSNKVHELSVRITQTLWPDGTFGAIWGYRDEARRKPSPHFLHKIAEQFGVPIEGVWLLGDTPTDIATARAAGAVAVGVTWGFRTRAELESAGADFVVDHPDDLP